MHGIDLADLYRERMTLRQVWVRVRALPPGSAVHRSVQDGLEKAESSQMVQDVEDALAMFGRGG